MCLSISVSLKLRPCSQVGLTDYMCRVVCAAAGHALVASNFSLSNTHDAIESI